MKKLQQLQFKARLASEGTNQWAFSAVEATPALPFQPFVKMQEVSSLLGSRSCGSC